MVVYEHMEQLTELRKPVYWAMGFFDGVHPGHRRVMAAAHHPGALCGVLTFDRHPLALLRPEAAPLLLTPDADYKAELIESLGGADVLLRLPFTAELAAMEPEAFLDALGEACSIAGVSVGANWRFGRAGRGTPELLGQLAAARGYAASVQELAVEQGAPVSSSRIRKELSAGRLHAANELLGRPFAISGVVEHGQKLARQLGFPTANICVPRHAALPPYGVYRVQCRVGGEWLAGVANIGLRPTIQEKTKITRLEVHFPGWHGDLYGQRLTVELLDFIRPERIFPSIDALQQQMLSDIERISKH